MQFQNFTAFYANVVSALAMSVRVKLSLGHGQRFIYTWTAKCADRTVEQYMDRVKSEDLSFLRHRLDSRK